MAKQCKTCGKRLYSDNISGFCQEHYRQEQDKLKVEHWLATGDAQKGISSTLRGPIRRYILQSQEHKCAICDITDEWNGKSLNFILDHIDGNASNDKQENVRLICPNCDSQLPTFKSRNKGSARTYR